MQNLWQSKAILNKIGKIYRSFVQQSAVKGKIL